MLLLLQYNANVHIPGKLKNQSPLLLAASLCKVDCMRVLLDNNADPNYQDIFGHTPLHYGTEILQSYCVGYCCVEYNCVECYCVAFYVFACSEKKACETWLLRFRRNFT